MPFRFCCERCGTEFHRHTSKLARFCGHSCKATFHGVAHMAVSAERRAALADERRGSGRGDGYVKRGGRHEHRVVAEEMLGRPLQPGEIVSHRDRHPAHNDPSNLEVFPSRAEFARALWTRRNRPCA